MGIYFFKIEIRKFSRNIYLSSLKTIGVVIGLSVAFISGYYIIHAYSYDNFQEYASDKYLLDNTESLGDEFSINRTPYPLVDSLENRYPEVISCISIEKEENSQTFLETSEGFVNTGGSSFAFVEKGYFSFFSYQFLVGGPGISLDKADPLIISERVAKKYFGGINALGKTVNIRIEERLFAFTITGVIKNPPGNTNFGFEWIGSLEHFNKTNGRVNYTSDWRESCDNYLFLKRGTNRSEFCKKLGEEYKAMAKLDEDPSLSLKSIQRLNLTSSEKKRLVVIASLGILILLISIINFVLLSTAESTQEYIQRGIEKVSGAGKKEILLRNILSGMIITVIASLLAIVLIVVVKPYLSKFFFYKFNTQINTLHIVALVSATIFFIALLGGSINSIIFFNQKPVDILKNKYKSGKLGNAFNNILLTFQLFSFIALIAVSLLINRQLKFMQSADLGFNKEALLSLKIFKEDQKSFSAFKQELLKEPVIEHVTGTSSPPMVTYTSIYGFVSKDSLGNKQFKMIEYIFVDKDYFETMEMELLYGNDFPDVNNGFCVVNESFLKEKEIDELIGEPVELGGRDYTICGVIKDFHKQSFHSKINPFVVYLNPAKTSYSMIRIGKGNIQETVSMIKKAAKKYLPNTPFDIEFMDDMVRKRYENDKKFSRLVVLLTILAVIISCCGLLGLSNLTAQTRTKEIGIRKVNGARVSEILAMLNNTFVKWVVVAFVIATPAAYYAMNKWLENFAYKTTLSWWIFALAGMMALGITLLTVSWQSWKAATRNPVEALRYE
jgi:putative ABC transport system permease protein